MFGRSIIDANQGEQVLFKPSIMNKIQRRPPRPIDAVNASRRVPRGYQPGLWTGCFNMFISPSVDAYWADCLRYMCSVEMRSQFKTSAANGNRNGSVALVMSQPHLPRVMSAVKPTHKPRAVLSFITWDQGHRDLRGLLAQALRTNNHFIDGHVLNAIEVDVSEEMGEPLLWYPVAHVAKEFRLAMYPRESRYYDKKILGSNFTLLQDSYYQHTKLTLILDKGAGRMSPLPPGSDAGGVDVRARNLLVLAYKSLEDATDPRLLDGWVRWSGAWEAYTHLQEKKLPVSTITLYVRENGMVKMKVPKETFKYVVLLEVVTSSEEQQQQLRAATQRLRVERWSGYTGVYTVHTMQEFADSFSSSDSISRIVGDVI